MAETRLVVTAQAEQALQEFERLRVGATGSVQAIDAASSRLDPMARSAAETAAAMRNVPAQVTDIITSLQGGMEPLTVLLQQGGQLRDMFGSSGAAARALGTYVLGLVNPFTVAAAAGAVLGLAYYQGSQEADAYTHSIVMSGNAAGTSADQLANMASKISDTIGTQGAAAGVLAELAGTGQVSADNLEQFAHVALEAQAYLKQAASETSGAFAELGEAPLEASTKLNDKLNYLTYSVYEQIKALQEQGDEEAAAAVAQNAYATALHDRSETMKANLGTLESAWKKLGDAGKQAWDYMLNVGRKDTLEDQLADVQDKINRARQKTYSFIDGPQAQKELVQLRATQSLLQSQVIERDRAAAAQAASVKQAKDQIEWDKELSTIQNRLLGETAQYATDLKKLQAARENGLITDEKYVEIVGKLATETYKNSDAAKEAEQASRAKTAAAAQEERAYATLIATIRSKIGENAQELAGGQKLTDGEKLQVRMTEDLASGKLKLSAAHQAVANSALVELAASEELIKAAAAQRDTTKFIAASTAARDASAQALAIEYAMFGKSAEAREMELVAVKAQTETQRQLDSLRAAGLPISDQILAQLDAEEKARVLVGQAVLGQGGALKYATELAAENKRFAAESIVDERTRAYALLQIDADLWRERIRLAGEGTEAQKLLQQNYDVWYQNQLAKPVLEEQRKMWASIEDTAHDTFVSVFDSGKSAFDRLEDTLKNGLLDALYQMTVKQWIINLQANVNGGGLSSLLGASGSTSAGSMGAMDWISAGKTIYSAFSGGVASSMGGMISSLGNLFGSQAVSAFGSGMGMTSAQASAAAAAYGSTGTAVGGGLSAGAGAASAIPVIGWIISGMMANNSYFKQGWNIDGQATDITKSLLASTLKGNPFGLLGGAMTYGINQGNTLLKKLGLSDQLASLLSGSSLWTRAFGHQKPSITAQGISGEFNGGGVLAEDWANVTQKGGWFRSDKNYTVRAPSDAAFAKGLTETFAQMKGAASSLADVLGVSTAGLTDFSYAFNITFDGDEAAREQQVADMLGGMGDALATSLVPNIASFSNEGEAASVTLQRLASDFTATNAVMQAIGVDGAVAFGAVGLASVEARERLISLAGGVDVLAAETEYFAQNFLTDAERIAPVQASVNARLAELGYAGVATEEQFKAAVLGLATSGALATEAGAHTYQGLLALAPAFKTLTDYMQQADEKAKELAASRRTLDIELMELQGDAAGALAARRADELAAMDASLRPQQERIYALQDEKNAIDAVKDAASVLLDGVDSSFSVLQKVIDRERAAADAAYETQMAAIQTSIDTTTAKISKLQSLSQTVQSALDQLQEPESDATASRAAAQAQIRSAIAIARAGGALPDADAIKGALSTVTRDASGQFATYTEYLRDFYTTANDVASLGQLTDSALSVEEETLAVLTEQKDDATSAHQATIDRLDAIKSSAQAQIDALKGGDSSLLSIEQAIQALGASVAQAQQNPVIGATSAINQAYQTALGRAPDAAGLEYWQNQAANGSSTENIVNAISKSQEAQLRSLYTSLLGRTADGAGMAYWMQQVKGGMSIDTVRELFIAGDEYKANRANRSIPAFAAGGNHIGGARLVGENGPEIEITGPSRIYNANQTAQIMRGSNEETMRENRALRKAVDDMRTMMEDHLYAIAKNTRTVADIEETREVIGQPKVRADGLSA